MKNKIIFLLSAVLCLTFATAEAQTYWKITRVFHLDNSPDNGSSLRGKPVKIDMMYGMANINIDNTHFFSFVNTGQVSAGSQVFGNVVTLPGYGQTYSVTDQAGRENNMLYSSRDISVVSAVLGRRFYAVPSTYQFFNTNARKIEPRRNQYDDSYRFQDSRTNTKHQNETHGYVKCPHCNDGICKTCGGTGFRRNEYTGNTIKCSCNKGLCEYCAGKGVRYQVK